MKTIYFFIICVLLFSCSKRKVDHFAYYFDEDARLKGNVATVQHSIYKVSDSGILLVVKYNCIYDSNYLMSYTYCTHNGNDSSVYNKGYFYNKNGLRVFCGKDNESIYKYDRHKNLIEWIYYRGANCEGRLLLDYDSLGRIIKRDVLANENQVEVRSTMRYNSAGDRETTITCFFSNECPTTYEHAKYDSFGNEVERMNYDARGEQTIAVYHKYVVDSIGNWVKNFTYIDGAITKIETREISYR